MGSALFRGKKSSVPHQLYRSTYSALQSARRLFKNQKTDLDKAIKELIENPLLGEQKKGDLAFLFVHKFKMVKQLTRLGYSHENGTVPVMLILNQVQHDEDSVTVRREWGCVCCIFSRHPNARQDLVLVLTSHPCWLVVF